MGDESLKFVRDAHPGAVVIGSESVVAGRTGAI